MPRPSCIEGYAIVSADGMIADARGRMPEALKLEADQRFFHSSLADVSAAAHGRHSQETDAGAAGRPRLILTHSIVAIARDPQNEKAVRWNPAGAGFEAAWDALGPPQGRLAVVGGTEVFGLFLEIGYDSFHLSRASKLRLPGGRPVFPQVGVRSPEEVLASFGLRPGPVRVLDESAGVSLCTWRRMDPGR